jgi:tRNA pseudouridine38-40 synthase
VTTLRLTVEYEGTRYRGWQEQKNARTVAGELRQALEVSLETAIELGGAGRTDAGVHALAQVAHVRWRGKARLGGIEERLAEALPPDIHVVALEPVDDRFHARHAALSRSYLYQISRRRVVESAEIGVDGDLVLFRIAASHFLWKMVRRAVGTLVELGGGALTLADLEALLKDGGRGARHRTAEWTAPPSGLFLERVAYAGDPPPGPLAAAVPVGRRAPASPR